MHLKEDYLVAHCNTDVLFVLCYNIEMSLNLLLQSSRAPLEQVAEYQIMGMFAAP